MQQPSASSGLPLQCSQNLQFPQHSISLPPIDNTALVWDRLRRPHSYALELKPMHRLLLAYFLVISGVALAAPTIVEKPTPAVSGASALVEDIGIETLGGVFTPLLSRGCKLPCSSTQVFSTADDRQTEIKLFLFRGNAKMTKNARPLGVYVVLGVPPEPRGLPQVAVTFSVEGNQISLTALDKKSNRALEIKRREF